jgi:vacuolar-type H+-ATPase subunit C/Vma6
MTTKTISINVKADAEAYARLQAQEDALEAAEQAFYDDYGAAYQHYMEEAGFELTEEELRAECLKAGENLLITADPQVWAAYCKVHKLPTSCK